MKLLLLGVAILGVFTGVGLLATNFQIYEVSTGNYVDAKWPGSSPTNVTWNLNFTSLPSSVNENGSGVTPQTVIGNAFSAWQNAKYNGSAVTDIKFTFGTQNASLPQAPAIDCQNVIGFGDTTPDAFATGIIAVTTISTITGGNVPSQCSSNPPPACPLDVCIVDADIMFNPTPPVPLATTGSGQFATSSPTSTQYDLQSIALHEIGHMIGLDHSGIAHAVMFPYGDTSLIGVHQTLWTDDMIGAGHLYPGAAPPNAGIEGQVTLSQPGTVALSLVYGAHVVAIDTTTGNAVTDTLTDPSGNYHLLLFGGSYYVYVQSLGLNSNWGPCTIDNFKGQAGYGDNDFGKIPSNPVDYTGVYY
jgi:hypothetical protein